MPSLSAVLLAGGRSQRMGCDKALLSLPGSDSLLWQRQLRVLEDLQPETLFLVGAAREGVADHVQIVPDNVRNAGPLAGVSACLHKVQTDLLVVLAVDLPRMDTAYLRTLAKRCASTRGVVPQRAKDIEPLAAVYPAVLRDLADDRLRQGRYAMHEFVREAARRELIDLVPVEAGDEIKFANVNSPEDVAKLEGYAR